MSKVLLIRFSNIALFFVVLVQAVTVAILLLEVKLPGEEIIDQTHTYNGLALIFLILVHPVLHWPSVKAMFLKKA